MRVVVTRPQPEARRWVSELVARGHAAQALPLIEIAPLKDTRALRQAWDRLAEYAAVMFVSGFAVRCFFAGNTAATPVFSAQGATKTRAWAPGPGTAKALREAGVPADCIDAPPLHGGQFDSEALWPVVAAQIIPGTRLLIVRGASAQPEGGLALHGNGRDWLATQVQKAGGIVDLLASYERRAPCWDEHARAQAQAALAATTVWLFSSAEAVQHLGLCMPGQSWAGSRALATHPRIAEAARAAGFVDVRQCRPSLADVCAALDGMGASA